MGTEVTDQELLKAMSEYVENNMITWMELADKLNIARENISRWKAGRPISKRIKRRLLEQFMPEALIPMAASDKSSSGDAIFLSRTDFVAVPVLSMAQAKELRGLSGIVEDIPAGEGVLFDHASPNDFAMVISGNSMMPWYPPGTKVLVSRDRIPKTGDRVIASLADYSEPLFKVYIDNGGTFSLLSINRNEGCEPITIDKMARDSWYWIWPIKSSIRNEQDIDKAMLAHGIHHFWEDWVENGGRN